MTTILGLPGSLRAQSYNRALVEAAAELAAPGVEVEVAHLDGVPLFNEDIEDEAVDQEPLSSLRRAVADADALLIATPEYNKGIPGVLKNTLDWLSRGQPSLLQGKPVAVMGATPGGWGTRVAQHHLRDVLVSCGCLLKLSPEVYVRGAADVFDDGRLVDEDTRRFVADLVDALATWTRRVSTD